MAGSGLLLDDRPCVCELCCCQDRSGWLSPSLSLAIRTGWRRLWYRHWLAVVSLARRHFLNPKGRQNNAEIARVPILSLSNLYSSLHGALPSIDNIETIDSTKERRNNYDGLWNDGRSRLNRPALQCWDHCRDRGSDCMGCQALFGQFDQLEPVGWQPIPA